MSTETLTYVGGPYDGQTTSATLRNSGRQRMLQGAVTEAMRLGYSRGIYKRDGDFMRWTSLPGEWPKNLRTQRGDSALFTLFVLAFFCVLIFISYTAERSTCRKKAEMMGLPWDWGFQTKCMVQVGKHQWVPIEAVRVVGDGKYQVEDTQ